MTPSNPAKRNEPSNASLLEAILDHGKISTQPYAGDWTAPWLLSSIHASIWHLPTPSARKVDGKWLGTMTITWDVLLSDHTNLLDANNEAMRIATQKIGFLMRALPMFDVSTSAAHAHRIRMLLQIVRWMYLHSNVYHPREHQYKCITGDAIADYIHRIMLGGIPWLMELPERSLQFFYKQALNRKPPDAVLDAPFSVPQSDCDGIFAWLVRNEYIYGSETRNLRFHINRDKIADVLGCDRDVLQTQKYACFLRQFEPDLKQSHPSLLIPSNGWTTEFPSHRTPTIKEVMDAKTTRGRGIGILETWKQIFRLERHLPENIPPITQINFKKASHLVDMGCGTDGLTPWIPLATSIAYTSKALELIYGIAEPLISFYIETILYFKKSGLFNAATDSTTTIRTKRAERDTWVADHLPPELATHSVCGWTSVYARYDGNMAFEKLRTHPSVGDLIEVVIGGTILLTGTLKPIRGANCVFYEITV